MDYWHGMFCTNCFKEDVKDGVWIDFPMFYVCRECFEGKKKKDWNITRAKLESLVLMEDL